MESDIPFPNRFSTNKAGPFSLASMGALDVSLSVSGVIELSPTDLTRKRTLR